MSQTNDKCRAGLLQDPTNEDAMVMFPDNFNPLRQAKQELDSIPSVPAKSSYNTALGMLAMRGQKFDKAATDLHRPFPPIPNPAKLTLPWLNIMPFRKMPKKLGRLENSGGTCPMRSTVGSLSWTISFKATRSMRPGSCWRNGNKAPAHIPAWVSLINLDLARSRAAPASLFDTISHRQIKFQALAGKASVSHNAQKPSPSFNSSFKDLHKFAQVHTSSPCLFLPFSPPHE